MSFGIDDFHDLIRLLEARPEWRADLRRLMLSEELLALPEQLALLRAETERRFQELATQVTTLTVAQQRTDEQITALTRIVRTLVEDVEVLKDDVKVLKDDVKVLKDDVRVIKVDIGELKGDALELRFREKAPAYLGHLVRRARVLSVAHLAELLEDAVEQGTLSEEEKNDVLLTDAVVRGRHKEDGNQVYLTIEVSWGIDSHDVERALRRAALLSKLGTPTLPVVAGRKTSNDVTALAQAKQVWLVIDGRSS